MLSKRASALWPGLALVAGSLAVAGTARAQAPNKDEASCRAFTQRFYDWYVALDAQNDKTHEARTAMDVALRLRPELFDHELLRMLTEDSAAQAKAHGIVGLDFDAFFYSQDPSPKFEARRAVVMNGHCRVLVRGVEQGTLQERVEPELVPRGGNWVFVNFHYPGSDLITILKSLAADRSKPASK